MTECLLGEAFGSSLPACSEMHRSYLRTVKFLCCNFSKRRFILSFHQQGSVFQEKVHKLWRQIELNKILAF